MTDLVEKRDETMLTLQEIREKLKELMIDNYISRFEALHEKEDVCYSLFSKSVYLSEVEQRIKVCLLDVVYGFVILRN